MIKPSLLVLSLLPLALICQRDGGMQEHRMTIIAPGHFHAALIQKNPLPGVCDTVMVYSPKGPGLNSYLETIESFESREDSPVKWNEKVYSGDDYLDVVPEASPGDFVVLSGNNRLKAGYILASIEKGYNVLSDKPMAISQGDLNMLEEAYRKASEKGLVIMEMMTERYDAFNQLAASLVNDKEFFGEWVSISMESVHHFFKEVAGSALRRPSWYYDIKQQGEGIVDVTTHLIDQAFRTVSPGHPFSDDDISLSDASHWKTYLTGEQFKLSTGEDPFPPFLEEYVKDEQLGVCANGVISFTAKGTPVEITVKWEYQGGPDTSASIFEGTRATVSIIQDESTDFKKKIVLSCSEKAAKEALSRLQGSFPYTTVNDTGEGDIILELSEKDISSHENHFNMVARTFLGYLDGNAIPSEEVSNTLSKYKLTIDAARMASEKDSSIKLD